MNSPTPGQKKVTSTHTQPRKCHTHAHPAKKTVTPSEKNVTLTHANDRRKNVTCLTHNIYLTVFECIVCFFVFNN